jgi:hypothetical protein
VYIFVVVVATSWFIRCPRSAVYKVSGEVAERRMKRRDRRHM